MELVHRKNVVGLRIRQARKKAKITQMELAAQLQLLGIMIDRSGIAKIEGDRRPVSDIEVAAIARIIKVPVSWFFEESDKFFSSAAPQ